MSGVVSFGVGEIFSIASQAGKLTQIGTFLQKNIGQVGLSIVQAGIHAVSQGVLSVMQGGSFEQAFWSGALGSLGASDWNAVMGTSGGATIYGINAYISGGWSWGGFAKAVFGGALTGAVSGALGQVFSAGSFWATVGNGGLAGAGSGGVNALTKLP